MTDSTPRRRWYQYSLRSLFLVTLALALWLGWICHKANQQKKAVEAIRGLGGGVYYDCDFDANGHFDTNGEFDAKGHERPAWFRNLVGVDFLASVNEAWLDDARVSDAELEHLQALTKLTALDLSGTRVTDAGLEYLRGLTRLRFLDLSDTRVTNDGLKHLQGMTRLETLWLDGTQVTNEGAEQLQAALPDCEISHWPYD